jgi:gliding motility-associated-like protein
MAFVNDLPALTISSDTTITVGESVGLTISGGGTYSWDPSTGLSCSDCADPIATPSTTTIYCATVTSTDGCIDTSCTEITVEELEETECQVFVPEGFSPNGDGNNDLECVYGSCISTINFQIFDRWGEKVFETETIGDCWNGTYRDEPMNSGVYAYILTYTLDTSEESITVKGNISLFR